MSDEQSKTPESNDAPEADKPGDVKAKKTSVKKTEESEGRAVGLQR